MSFSHSGPRACWVYIDVSFVLAPPPNRVPFTFTLPHPLYDGCDVCVVTPAPQKRFKDELAADNNPLTRTPKIIDVAKLEAKFSNPVALRTLAKSFDVFFVHGGVQHFPVLMTGELLKFSTPVMMDRDDGHSFTEQLNRTRFRVTFPRRGFSHATVAIGQTNMSPEQLTSNAGSLLKQLVDRLPGQHSSILAIRISSTSTSKQRATLPIYAHDFTSELKGSAPCHPTQRSVQDSQSDDVTHHKHGKKRRRTGPL